MDEVVELFQNQRSYIQTRWLPISKDSPNFDRFRWPESGNPNMEIKSTVKVAGGKLIRFSHQSTETGTPMTCSVFLPADVERDAVGVKNPYIVYLSGLTCTDENVCQKSGVFMKLAELKVFISCFVVSHELFITFTLCIPVQLAFVAPDTSPRGAQIEGEDDSWDFGTGAGFYVDATAPKWSKNYRMYSYVTKELPAFLAEHFPVLDQSRYKIIKVTPTMLPQNLFHSLLSQFSQCVSNRVSITGHSMGGHGALTIALKNPTQYKYVISDSAVIYYYIITLTHALTFGYLFTPSQ